MYIKFKPVNNNHKYISEWTCRGEREREGERSQLEINTSLLVLRLSIFLVDHETLSVGDHSRLATMSLYFVNSKKEKKKKKHTEKYVKRNNNNSSGN